MPIIGTPISEAEPGIPGSPGVTVVMPEPCCDMPTSHMPAAPTAVACAGQYILSPRVPTSRGKPVLTRTSAITIRGGQAATIEWQMRDRDGNPVDLDACLCIDESEVASSISSVSSGSSVSSSVSSGSSASEATCDYAMKFRIHEYLSLGRSCPAANEFDVTLVNGNLGLVQVELPTSLTRKPGVYFGEMALVGTDADGEYVVFSNVFYVHIDRANWSGRRIACSMGPPSIAEIRLHLRDSGPEESYLLDNLRFDDAEIMACIVRGVQQWNETPPNVAYYTTQTFPFRHFWLEAITGYLFLIVAEQFRANNLKYSAAGIAIDDQDKEPNYEKAAERRLANWQNFIRTKKAEINLSAAYASFGSPYNYSR